MNSLKKQKFLFIFIIFLFLFLLTIIFDYGLSYLKPDPKVRTFEVENFREQIVVRLMSHPPNSIKYRKSNYIDELRYLKIDDNGFIVPSVRHKKPDKTIYFLGGSTTELFDVPSEQRFPYKVGLNLENMGFGKINSINAGLNGKYSVSSLQDLLTRGALFNPQYTVLMHAANDLSMLMHLDGYYSNDLAYKHSRSYLLKVDHGADELEINGRTGLFFKGIKNIARSVYPNTYSVLSTKFHKNSQNYDEFEKYRQKKRIDSYRLNDEFEKSLNRFVYSACSLGIQPILMTQPNRIENQDEEIKLIFKKYNPEISYKDYSKTYKMFNQTIRKVSENFGIPLIDAAIMIPKDKKYIYDAFHLTEKGSILLSEVITEILANLFENAKVKNSPDTKSQIFSCK